MAFSLSEIEKFVLNLKAQGAVEIKVGDVVVTFKQDIATIDFEKMLSTNTKKEQEDLLFFSS